MEPAKKKSKKLFSVPVAKPTTPTQEIASKDENADSNMNKNNNIETSVSSTASANDDKKRKKKSDNKQKKNEKRDGLERKQRKPKIKTEVEVNKNKEHENTNDATVGKISKLAKDTNVGKPKVQRSLTDVEYDDLFMSVLQSVMKAEQDGDQSDSNKQVGHVPTADKTNEKANEPKEKGGEKTHGKVSDESNDNDLESDEDEACSQVIEVTVKMEDLEEQEKFDNIETEDIDKWESGVGNKEISMKSEDQTLPGKEKTTEPDSTEQNKMSAKSSSQKQQKVLKNGKTKEKNINWQTKAKVSKMSTSKVKADTKKNSTFRKHMEKKSLKQVMLERELEDLGTWVQCGNTSCLKWRYLKNITDPMEIPQRWECSMNSDEACNSCDKPEEDYDESEHIYTKYTEGSVVLAKMAGYPWWPGMIEIDPDYDTYFEVAVPASMYPTKYHVVFFDKNVSRAWIGFSSIKPFDEIEASPKKCKGHNYTREVNDAIKNAKDALELPIKERLKKYSFGTRFSGKWGHLGEKFAHKKRKQRSNGTRKLSQKITPDKVVEQLVDDNTLDKILNNSQSVFSDVVEMISSIENGNFDSDEDPEYDPEEQCNKEKVSSVPVKISGKLKECSLRKDSPILDKEADNIMDKAVKFDKEELDKDIFTMELGSTQIEDLDIQKAVDECNIRQMDSDFCDVVNINEVRDEQNSDKKNEVSASGSEYKGRNSELTQTKTKKSRGSSLGKGKKKKADEEDFKKSQVKDESVEMKKSNKNKDITMVKSSNEKGKSLKKKKNKEETIDLTSKVSEGGTADDIVRWVTSDGTEMGKEFRKKNKHQVKDTSVNSAGKAPANETSQDTKPMDREIDEFEHYVEKKKRAKEESKERSVELVNTPSATTGERDMSQRNSMSQNEKKKKKSRAKFINPVQSTEKKDNSQKKNKDGKISDDIMSKTSQSVDKLSQKSIRKHKNKLEKVETDEGVHENKNGDELDQNVDMVGRPPMEIDSDEDFMLDLNDMANEKRAIEPSNANVVDGDDSEPLDFEE